jgi:hypothetical protein
MADTGTWPIVPPAVHSGNLEGGARMLGLIARHWGEPAPDDDTAAPPATPAARRADLTAVAPLTTCPSCGARRVSRAPRGSNLARLRSLVTRRNPLRCSACGWAKWVREPILVRLSSSMAEPPEELSRTEFDRIDPEE